MSRHVVDVYAGDLVVVRVIRPGMDTGDAGDAVPLAGTVEVEARPEAVEVTARREDEAWFGRLLVEVP